MVKTSIIVGSLGVPCVHHIINALTKFGYCEYKLAIVYGWSVSPLASKS
jgi:hypothetical protein